VGTGFDLLSTVEQGGCSAKLPAQLLDSILKDIPVSYSENLIVGTETNDDASVYKIREDLAIIQSTDFFKQSTIFFESVLLQLKSSPPDVCGSTSSILRL